jgi:hypothetical protein
MVLTDLLLIVSYMHIYWYRKKAVHLTVTSPVVRCVMAD